ncbi:putative DNA-binding transcriptional regulator AlpA [Variovorax boronicumulans]|uniref:helix-turn-helix transcriptional regulator n=1 Tax=Variovorax boronicumulans TaxID=436515 RepID=UPI0027870277|nr:AlpA family phage regulatory protein [Variovorax boronicumulans]MDP9908272.1 putative DNA-binding transcriptional regulator AlpA [Variovorax boronicumulans]
MTALLRELLQCNHSDPNRRRAGAGKWVTVNVPAELWEKIQAATDQAESRSSVPTHKHRAPPAQTLQAALIPDALLRIDVVEHLTGLGESTIRRKMATANFPQPIKNGARCTRWRAGDVTTWLRQQGAAA